MKKTFLHTLLVYILLLAGFFLLARSPYLSAGPLPRTPARASDADFRLIQARFSADYWMAFRNENAEELQSALKRADQAGGFPDWMKEYGRRLLDSCGRNAILFTGTLIDTIGAWYCQSVQKYRKDVVVLPMGMLDRVWLVDAMNRWRGFLGTREAECDLSQARERLSCEKAYADANLSGFLSILGRRNKDRPVYLSMDLNPGFLKALQDRLSLSGCAFRLHAAPIRTGEERIDLAFTNRLFSEPSRFDAIRRQNRPAILEVDSIRSHYRFAAVQLRNALRSGGNGPVMDRLSEWIRAAFTNDLIPAPESIESDGIRNSPERKGN
jgi:hypothetical protein